MFAYLDAYNERLEDVTQAAFDSEIEAVRAGTIFARNRKAYDAWRRKNASRYGRKVGLTGEALENAIMAMAAQHPEYVVFGGSA